MNKIQHIKDQLHARDKEFFEKKSWTMTELTEWFTEVLILFDTIKVNSEIISSFSTLFNSHLIRSNGESSVFTILGDQTLILKNASVHIMNIKNAFQYAYKKIELMEEEERLVPKFVMEFFESGDKYGAIYTALSSIEKAIIEKNIVSLESSSNTLLDSVLGRVEELTGMDLSKKLRKLNSDPGLLDKVSMRKEMLIALDNSRVIRNLELIHPKENIRQTIPYICAISYAYLVILQLKIMMNVGIFEE
jgi:hypothetical protein